MIDIVIFFVKENIKSYVIAMVLLSILFVLCGISYESFLTNQTQMSYTESLNNSIWIYPSRVVSEEQNGHVELGRALQEIVEFNEEYYACIFLEEFLSESFLQGLEGRNFSYKEEANEVILYGDVLNTQFEVGENILLNGISYQVVGKLPSYMPFWNLFFYSSDIEMSNTYMHAMNGDMFFINNKNAFKGKSVVSSNILCSQEMSSWGEGISMKVVKERLFEEIKGKQLFEVTSIILLFGLSGYFCLVLSVIQYKKTGKLLGILFLCGINKMKSYLFLLVNSFFVIGGAIFFYVSYMLFRSALFSRQEYIDERFWQGQQCILGGLCGMMFCILLGFHLWEYRTSVLHLLSEKVE